MTNAALSRKLKNQKRILKLIAHRNMSISGEPRTAALRFTNAVSTKRSTSRIFSWKAISSCDAKSFTTSMTRPDKASTPSRSLLSSKFIRSTSSNPIVSTKSTIASAINLVFLFLMLCSTQIVTGE